MKKYSTLFVVLALAVSLAACGGGNNENSGAAGSNNDQVAEQPGNGQEQGNAEQPENAAEQPTDQEQQEPAEPAPSVEPPAATKDVEIRVEGDLEMRPGTLVETDNGYYMYTIEPFKFTPEEPGVDQVFMEKFPDYFMKIEALPSDVKLDEVRANAEAELKAVDEQVFEQKGAEIGDPFIREAKFFLHVSTSELTKNIIVMEIDGQLFKFTINMPNGEASEGAGPGFWAMIKTVKPAPTK